MAYLERTLQAEIARVSETFRILLLTGQRQVGKSTLLKAMAAGTARRFVSLDHLPLRKLAREDPELFLQQNPPPLIVDEVQYAPELFPYLKIYADEHPEHKGAFWLSGSQKYRLMEGVRESLAGRIAIVDLLGLSFREKRRAPAYAPFLPALAAPPIDEELAPKPTARDVYRLIWEGSLPEPVVESLDRERYYAAYVQSYIERDVRDFYDIAKPIQFFDFLSLAAARTGALLNYSELARGAGIDVKTAQTWIGVLERSGLVYLLRPYSPNPGKRIVKSPKLYFLDTGLCAYLTRWLTPESLMAGAMAGPMLETYAVGEILKSYLHNGRTPLIYHYRDMEKNEVDVLIEQDGALYPVEIKKTANPGRNDVRAFAKLDALGKPRGLGAVLCLQPERVALNREAVSIPVWSV
ncbi:MAG: ATP-binding protein [Candidatus Accumulibacter sp.]|jgi:predicted AAA+ superfamily ATPase|nr:ATP-binding protein [Accumulibacter sp.]